MKSSRGLSSSFRLLKSRLFPNAKLFSTFKEAREVGIVGAGLMGSGISVLANALTDKKIRLIDLNHKALDGCEAYINWWLDKEVRKGRINDGERDEFLSKISFSTDFSTLKDADLVIESVSENYEAKKIAMQDLDKVVPSDCVVASTTSSMSITRIASFTNRPGYVVGVHFLYPVPVIKMVEVIKGLHTTDETHKMGLDLARSLNKNIVEAKDVPGFLINRMLAPYINEAAYVLYEGIASTEDIDNAMQMGTNIPMGPLQLADFVGLDNILSILRVLQNDFGDPKYRPCPLLVNYVDAGFLGCKSGRGFYKYQ